MNRIKDFIRRVRMMLLRARACAGRRELCGAGETCPAAETAGGVLIVAPHPDDEILGCGGLIARLVRLGNPPEVVILSGGGGSHRGCCGLDEETLVGRRRGLALKAAEAVGLPAGNVHFLDFTDGSISEDDRENVERLRGLYARLKPSAVFVPHGGEGWPDHLAARRLGLSLTEGPAGDSPEGLAERSVGGSTESSAEGLTGGSTGNPAEGSAAVCVYEYCVWMWYYNVWRLDWRNALTLKMTREEHSRKLAAEDIYVKSLAPCGKPWSGVLPPLFLEACRWNRELYFKVGRSGNPEHKREAL